MSSFTDSVLELRWNPDGIDEDRWILLHPIVWEVDELDAGHEVITVPAGFETDLASVPRLLWPAIPPHGRHGAAAVLHDWLYKQRRPRAWADRQFRLALAALGVRWVKRWAMWFGVRIGGGPKLFRDW